MGQEIRNCSYEIFYGFSSFVASTMEAILIDFPKLNELTNDRRGTYYGGIDKWNKKTLMNMGK
jgi:hypothetical protein